MNAIIHSPEFLSKRKLYTLLPLLVLPFVTLFYWAISGFIPKEPLYDSNGGLNINLPDALLPQKNMDKLAYYKKAAEDSLKKIEMIKKDPYRQLQIEKSLQQQSELKGLDGGIKKEKPVSYKGRMYSDPGQAKVYAKLKELEEALAASPEPDFQAADELPMEKQPSVEITAIPAPEIQQIPVSPQMQKLQALMTGLHPQTIQAVDPEMQELHSLLDKIISIQQPQKSDPVLKASQADRRRVFSVELPKEEVEITLLEAIDNAPKDSLSENRLHLPAFEHNGFFSLEDQSRDPFQNTIAAVVDQDQTILSGATVKFRMTCDVYIAGRLVPEGTFLYGRASVTGERLKVEITSVWLENALLPVSLSTFDLDGQEGIYVPDAITRQVAKQAIAQDIQGVNLSALDTSLGAQAASAGIQATKTLLGRKARLVQVKLQAGYNVLLRDNNARSI